MFDREILIFAVDLRILLQNIQSEDRKMNDSSATAETTCSSEISHLMDVAHEMRQFAYAPYSQFSVGAAVLGQDGTVFRGANVENASYGLSVCAERVAVMNAVTSGQRQLKAIAVCCDVKNSFKGPCGACRQVLIEFGSDLDLYLVRPDKKWKRVTLESLLPLAFTPAALEEERD